MPPSAPCLFPLEFQGVKPQNQEQEDECLSPGTLSTYGMIHLILSLKSKTKVYIFFTQMTGSYPFPRADLFFQKLPVCF